MGDLLNIWKQNRSFFSGKKLSQIIAFAGDGNIESEATYKQIRELFSEIPTSTIKEYVEECLHGFDKSGFVLQDLVNEIGNRLGFKVTNGRYRGSIKKNGFDGLWETQEAAIIVESKTTDAYRINLDALNKYKSLLINERIDLSEKVSILIVAGRQDTGDLEAQIRGSRYAWDIRLLSIDSLLKLLDLKETFNDSKTIRQIYEVLRPQEYTRLDRLIDLIFLSVQDAELEVTQDLQEEKGVNEGANEHKTSPERAGFHGECVEKLALKQGKNFLKRANTLYASGDEIGVVINVSKEHVQGGRPKYWFAFHPHFTDNLSEFSSQYILYGCGSAMQSFLLPLQIIEENKKYMWHTERTNGAVYWHVNIFKFEDGHYYLQTPLNEETPWISLDKYKL